MRVTQNEMGIFLIRPSRAGLVIPLIYFADSLLLSLSASM